MAIKDKTLFKQPPGQPPDQQGLAGEHKKTVDKYQQEIKILKASKEELEQKLMAKETLISVMSAHKIKSEAAQNEVSNLKSNSQE